MNEREFTDYFIKALNLSIAPFQIATKKKVLYQMAINDKGHVDMGVDIDSGEPIRGRGKGFEQDILIYEETEGGHTSFIPRVIAEVKLGKVTTHDSIVYSEKARRIRRIYPFVRYGLILADMKNIPGRVLRLGDEFDFIEVVGNPLTPSDLKQCIELFKSELETSLGLSKLLFGNKKITSLRKRFVAVEAHQKG